MLVTTILAEVPDKFLIYRTSERLYKKSLPPQKWPTWSPVVVKPKPGADRFRYFRYGPKRNPLPAKPAKKWANYFGTRHVKLPKPKVTVKYLHPNPFVFHREMGIGACYMSTGQWAKSYALGTPASLTKNWSTEQTALNIASARFIDLIRGDTANLGETFGEVGQSLDAMENRSRQLRLAFGALRRGRFREMYRCLNLNASDFNRHPGADLRGRAKQRAGDIGGAWLEYWFGWAPLVGDIMTSVRTITGARPLSKDRVVAKATTRDVYHSTWSPGSLPSIQHGEIRVHVRVQARVTVSSGPRVLASQLGLNNPAMTAWNITRFSWLVDWFSNVSRFLDSWNWTDGFTFTDAFFTTSYEGSDLFNYDSVDVVNVKFFRVVRSLGIPVYRLTAPRLPKSLSPTRAATAISLLLQTFASVHTDTTHFGAKHLK